MAERFFAEDFGFLFNNASLCCLCLLITAVVVINFGLNCFTNSVLAYFHIPHIYCLIISLEGLDALGRLDLEGLLLFIYPNFIL